MKQLVLKTRSPSGREQCVLDAIYPCEFSLGGDGDWRPVGFSGSEHCSIEYDGSTWRLQPLSGTLCTEGVALESRLELQSPAVISCGSAWLIIDDELEPGVETVLLPRLLARRAGRTSRRPPPPPPPFDDDSTCQTTPLKIVPRADAPIAEPEPKLQPELQAQPWQVASVQPVRISRPSSAGANMLDETRAVDPSRLYAERVSDSRTPPRVVQPAVKPPPSAPPPSPIPRRAAPKRSVVAEAKARVTEPKASSRITFLARGVGLVSAVICLLGSYRITRGAHAGSVAAEPARLATVSAAERPAAKPPLAVVEPRLELPSNSPPPSPKAAADAFIRGEQASALSLYRQLSLAEPQNQAYALIVSSLARRRAPEFNR